MCYEGESAADIPIILVFEDDVSKEVLQKIIQFSGKRHSVGQALHGRGYGYIKRNIAGFNRAARGIPYLILTDLDTCECAPSKIRDWLPVPIHPNRSRSERSLSPL
jgi:hypothetical protein